MKESLTDADVEALYTECDTNGDGKIELDEFVHMMVCTFDGLEAVAIDEAVAIAEAVPIAEAVAIDEAVTIAEAVAIAEAVPIAEACPLTELWPLTKPWPLTILRATIRRATAPTRSLSEPTSAIAIVSRRCSAPNGEATRRRLASLVMSSRR